MSVSKDLRDYFFHFTKNILPELKKADVFVNIAPPADALDVKQCTELGAALLLGKPILLLVAKGRAVPDGLRRCADAVLEDWNPLGPEGARQVAEALKRMGGEDG